MYKYFFQISYLVRVIVAPLEFLFFLVVELFDKTIAVKQQMSANKLDQILLQSILSS